MDRESTAEYVDRAETGDGKRPPIPLCAASSSCDFCASCGQSRMAAVPSEDLTTDFTDYMDGDRAFVRIRGIRAIRGEWRHRFVLVSVYRARKSASFVVNGPGHLSFRGAKRRSNPAGWLAWPRRGTNPEPRTLNPEPRTLNLKPSSQSDSELDFQDIFQQRYQALAMNARPRRNHPHVQPDMSPPASSIKGSAKHAPYNPANLTADRRDSRPL